MRQAEHRVSVTSHVVPSLVSRATGSPGRSRACRAVQREGLLSPARERVQR